MTALLSVLAALEREILRERVRAELDHARQGGKCPSWPVAAALYTNEVQKFRRASQKIPNVCASCQKWPYIYECFHQNG